MATVEVTFERYVRSFESWARSNAKRPGLTDPDAFEYYDDQRFVVIFKENLVLVSSPERTDYILDENSAPETLRTLIAEYTAYLNREYPEAEVKIKVQQKR
jgi:hypothetical protein